MFARFVYIKDGFESMKSLNCCFTVHLYIIPWHLKESLTGEEFLVRISNNFIAFFLKKIYIFHPWVWAWNIYWHIFCKYKDTLSNFVISFFDHFAFSILFLSMIFIILIWMCLRIFFSHLTGTLQIFCICVNELSSSRKCLDCNSYLIEIAFLAFWDYNNPYVFPLEFIPKFSCCLFILRLFFIFYCCLSFSANHLGAQEFYIQLLISLTRIFSDIFHSTYQIFQFCDFCLYFSHFYSHILLYFIGYNSLIY